MTFFLNEKPTQPRRGPNVPLPSNSGGIGAAFRSALRDQDLFLNYSRAKDQEATPVAVDAGERIGVDGLNDYFHKNNPNGPGVQMPDGSSVQDFIDWYGADLVLEAARKRSEMEPDKFTDLDLTREGVEARAVERQKAEDSADSQLVALSPNPIRNSLVGALGAGVVDPINIAAIPFGLGGGSILRTMVREAMINGAIEGIQNPTRVETAERLGKEAPGMLESVAQGALMGAALGGVLEGVFRGLRTLAYYREIKRTAPDPTLTPVTQEAAIQSAEKAIVTGEDPLKAVRQAVLAEPTPARRPLIVDEDVAVTPEPTALAPEPITAAPLEPTPGIPNTVDQITAVAETGITKAVRGKKEPKPTDLSTFIIKNGGIWKGDDRGEIAALEYRRPGFIKNTKFARSSAGDNRGGRTLDDIREMAEQAGYLPPQSSINDLLDALADDVWGNKRYALGEAGPTNRKVYSDDYIPERAWADPDPEERGWVVRLDDYEFTDGNNVFIAITRDFDTYLTDKGYTLLPSEKEEILSVLTTRGGDAEDLIHSAMSRVRDEAEYAILRAMRGEVYGGSEINVPWGDEISFGPFKDPWGEETGMGAVPDHPNGSVVVAPQASARDASELGAGVGEFASERTDIGDQLLIPGTRKLDEYQKHVAKARAEARALQSAMRSSAPQARVEDDVGGLFGGAQREMFSEPADPKSKPTQIAMIEDLRDTLARGDDFMVDLGNGPMNASALLRELDDDLDFEDILNACGKRGPA